MDKNVIQKILDGLILLKENHLKVLLHDFSNPESTLSHDDKKILEGKIIQCNFDLQLFTETKKELENDF